MILLLFHHMHNTRILLLLSFASFSLTPKVHFDPMNIQLAESPQNLHLKFVRSLHMAHDGYLDVFLNRDPNGSDPELACG